VAKEHSKSINFGETLPAVPAAMAPENGSKSASLKPDTKRIVLALAPVAIS